MLGFACIAAGALTGYARDALKGRSRRYVAGVLGIGVVTLSLLYYAPRAESTYEALPSPSMRIAGGPLRPYLARSRRMLLGGLRDDELVYADHLAVPSFQHFGDRYRRLPHFRPGRRLTRPGSRTGLPYPWTAMHVSRRRCRIPGRDSRPLVHARIDARQSRNASRCPYREDRRANTRLRPAHAPRRIANLGLLPGLPAERGLAIYLEAGTIGEAAADGDGDVGGQISVRRGQALTGQRPARSTAYRDLRRQSRCAPGQSCSRTLLISPLETSGETRIRRRRRWGCRCSW